MPPKSSRPHHPLDEESRARVAQWAGEHWNAVFGLLYRLTYRRQEAEDLTQETFLRAAAQFDSFTPGTNARAWLMRIAVNAKMDAGRRQKIGKMEAMPDGLTAVGDGAADTLSGQELSRVLESSLAELPETARIVFLLRTREGLSFREIGQAIETTEETARWHMLQARKQLLEKLTPWL